jgi:hypothetical protein
MEYRTLKNQNSTDAIASADQAIQAAHRSGGPVNMALTINPIQDPMRAQATPSHLHDVGWATVRLIGSLAILAICIRILPTWQAVLGIYLIGSAALIIDAGAHAFYGRLKRSEFCATARLEKPS